ncbi:hypothetical protein ACJJTC_007263 [Scirpophaga incertulas]
MCTTVSTRQLWWLFFRSEESSHRSGKPAQGILADKCCGDYIGLRLNRKTNNTHTPQLVTLPKLAENSDVHNQAGFFSAQKNPYKGAGSPPKASPQKVLRRLYWTQTESTWLSPVCRPTCLA